MATFTVHVSALSSHAPAQCKPPPAQYCSQLRPIIPPARTLQPSWEHRAFTSGSFLHNCGCGLVAGGTAGGDGVGLAGGSGCADAFVLHSQMRSEVPGRVELQDSSLFSSQESSNSSQAETQKRPLSEQYWAQVLPSMSDASTLQPLEEQNSLTLGRVHSANTTGACVDDAGADDPGAGAGADVDATAAHSQIKSEVPGHTSSHSMSALTSQSLSTSSQAPAHSSPFLPQYSVQVRPVMPPTSTLQPSSEQVSFTSESAVQVWDCGFFVPEGTGVKTASSGGSTVVVGAGVVVASSCGSGLHSQSCVSPGRASLQLRKVSASMEQPSPAQAQAPAQ